MIRVLAKESFGTFMRTFVTYICATVVFNCAGNIFNGLMFLFRLFCLIGKSQKFVLLSALTDISKMDSLTGQQLIKADGSSHAAEAALDGKVSEKSHFQLTRMYQ